MPGHTKNTSSDAAVPTDRPITRGDIEAKFRALGSDVDTAADSAKGTVLVVGAVVAVGLLLGAFLLGKKRGRKKTAFIEIRRV